ncbi:hypothetical protein JCM8097_007358 [Rhodosporidiobolus ruineniae]
MSDSDASSVKTKAEDQPVVLDLVDGPYRPTSSLASKAHTTISVTALLFRLPFHLLWHYIFYRLWSPYVQDLGRSWVTEAVAQVTRLAIMRLSLTSSRYFYTLSATKPNEWLGETLSIAGTRGKWIAPPGTEGKRAEDDLVMLFIHGGAFVLDMSPSCDFQLLLSKEMHARGVKFSIFMHDYQLAPEKLYPSQLIECLAAYHYLVNELGISPAKICLAGDSAGGNLVTSLLLHLARPNPKIYVPKALGPTPERPGSVMLISPWIDLLSRRLSRTPSYISDYIEHGGVFNGALCYVGAVRPYPPEVAGRRDAPSWRPLDILFDRDPADGPPEEVTVEKLRPKVEEAEKEGKGLALLASPYVNPSTEVVTDRSWYKEALPGNGKTFVSWGGKEIFADDIADFVSVLDEAGVAPYKLVKPLGPHDWPILDAFLPIAAQDRLGGEQSKPGYAIGAVADWLVERAKEVKA